MILADTSAWVEYDRATGSRVDQRLVELISEDGLLAVTEPVLMEIVAGAQSNVHEVNLRRLLLRFPLLSFDGAIDFEAAAMIYRQCRRVGITPLGMVDCMIASVAHRHGASLLTADAGLSRIARTIEISLDHASIAP